jgi:hypothetical protein
MGSYPLFACRDWSKLHVDLETMPRDIVSIVLVTDPFGDYDKAYLQRCFTHLAVPFKEHFVVDLRRSPADHVIPHHVRNVRKALAGVRVEIGSSPLMWADDWCRLYAMLTVRHTISGVAAFSPGALTAQMAVPGLTALRAVCRGDTVGMALWYEHRRIAYYHLAAYSPHGYDLRASFALIWHGIQHFRERGFEWVCLGAGAGLQAREDGLTRFKRGWATGTRTAFLCGRIFDPTEYERLARLRGIPAGAPYFPAYRYVARAR